MTVQYLKYRKNGIYDNNKNSSILFKVKQEWSRNNLNKQQTYKIYIIKYNESTTKQLTGL